MDALKASGLVAHGEFIVPNGAPVDYAREHIPKVIESRLDDAMIWIDADRLSAVMRWSGWVKISSTGMPRLASIAGPCWTRTTNSCSPAVPLTDGPRLKLRAHVDGGVAGRVCLPVGFNRQVLSVWAVERAFGRRGI